MVWQFWGRAAGDVLSLTAQDVFYCPPTIHPTDNNFLQLRSRQERQFSWLQKRNPPRLRLCAFDGHAQDIRLVNSEFFTDARPTR